MKAFELRDIKDHVFLTLAEILAALPERAITSSWAVEDFIDVDGEPYFWIGANGDEAIADLANTGIRISGSELVQRAATTAQIIFGTFRGYDPASAAAPWIVLHAYDSSFWRCETDDVPTQRQLVGAFRDVRVLAA